MACAFDLLRLPGTLWRRDKLSVSQQELGSAGSVSGFFTRWKESLKETGRNIQQPSLDIIMYAQLVFTGNL